MKKLFLFLNTVARFYLLLLLIPLLMQSCELGKEAEVSLDGSHQSYSGPSYPNSSPDDSKVGVNFGLFFLFSYGSGLGQHHDRSGTFNNPNSQQIINLYALSTHGPSAFDNSGVTYRETEPSFSTSQSFKNKAASKAMSHITGRGGIEFVQKKSKDGGTKITLNYLEVPLYALYNYQLPSAGNIFGGLGPYFAYGIGGKMKSTYNGQTTEIKSFNKTNGFKPFDAGLGITAGYHIPNNFSFRLAYEIGFVNILRNAFGDKAKNRSISLNISYPLNKIIKK